MSNIVLRPFSKWATYHMWSLTFSPCALAYYYLMYSCHICYRYRCIMFQMMAPATGMVSSTIQQPPCRNQQRPRKPNSSGKPQLIVKPPSVTISAPSTINTSVSQDIPKGPPVTVFVGNITEKAPDLMIRQILSSCGHVMSWKRVQGILNRRARIDYVREKFQLFSTFLRVHSIRLLRVW